MRQILLALTLLGGTLASAPTKVLAQDASGRKVTVAILDFTASAMVKRDQYAALADGIPLVLGTELVSHPAIELVERQALQAMLNELQLGASDKVDPQMAVKIGKLVNARYIVLGGFLVDFREDMELTSRVVEVETGIVRGATKVRGKGDNVFEIIAKLTKALSPLLDLPTPPAGQPRPSEGAKQGDDLRGFVLFTEAQKAEGLGNKEEALRLAKNAVTVAPSFEPEYRRMAARLGVL